MVISFIGHRSLHSRNTLLESIRKTITENADFNDEVVFLVGGYGDFDSLCAYVCSLIKKERKNCKIVFVTPYITVAQQEKIRGWIELGIYDSVIYPPLENVPPRFAIVKRNEWMIEQSDLIIAYVVRSFGGAYQSLNYARRKKKQIVQLQE